MEESVTVAITRKANLVMAESRKVDTGNRMKGHVWSYNDDELRAWWHHSKQGKGRGEVIDKGVSTLGAVKRMWWLTALFTGVSKKSLEGLRWTDVDLKKKLIRFRTSNDNLHTVPIADVLAGLLAAYRDSPDVPRSKSKWVFPSTVVPDGHLRDVKDPLAGVGPARRLQYTFRDLLAEVGATPDQSKRLTLRAASPKSSADRRELESLRPLVNAVAGRYLKILGWPSPL